MRRAGYAVGFSLLVAGAYFWLAPTGAITEAFTVTTTAVVAGIALGNAAAGALVDSIGPGWTFVAAAAVSGLAPGLVASQTNSAVSVS